MYGAATTGGGHESGMLFKLRSESNGLKFCIISALFADGRGPGGRGPRHMVSFTE
jgi:hypothetical protein